MQYPELDLKFTWVKQGVVLDVVNEVLTQDGLHDFMDTVQVLQPEESPAILGLPLLLPGLTQRVSLNIE